jgi:hypothetical protein
MGSIGILSCVVGRDGSILSVAVVSSDYRRTVYDSAPLDRLITERSGVHRDPSAWWRKNERHARREILDTPDGGS